jgi:hypothetical protein
LLAILAIGSTVRAESVAVGTVAPYFVQNFGYVRSVSFSSFAPEGVIYSAYMNAAPPGFYWNPAQGINATSSQGSTIYLIRQGGPAQNVVPFQIGWRKWSTVNGVNGPEVHESFLGIADGRTPEQLVNSPVFERAWVQERNGQWLISGRVQNESGPTIYEYWDGAQWLPMRNLLTSNTNFFSLIPKGIANPLIRSYKVATPGAVSWTHGTAPPTMDYGRVRARIVTPAGPPNRFNIKAKTVAVGVRG